MNFSALRWKRCGTATCPEATMPPRPRETPSGSVTCLMLMACAPGATSVSARARARVSEIRSRLRASGVPPLPPRDGVSAQSSHKTPPSWVFFDAPGGVAANGHLLGWETGTAAAARAIWTRCGRGVEDLRLFQKGIGRGAGEALPTGRSLGLLRPHQLSLAVF